MITATIFATPMYKNLQTDTLQLIIIFVDKNL